MKKNDDSLPYLDLKNASENLLKVPRLSRIRISFDNYGGVERTEREKFPIPSKISLLRSNSVNRVKISQIPYRRVFTELDTPYFKLNLESCFRLPKIRGSLSEKRVW